MLESDLLYILCMCAIIRSNETEAEKKNDNPTKKKTTAEICIKWLACESMRDKLRVRESYVYEQRWVPVSAWAMKMCMCT